MKIYILSLFLCVNVVLTIDYIGENCIEKGYPDLVLILDNSGSVCDMDMDYEYGVNTTCRSFVSYIKFVHDLVASLEVGADATNVAVIRYDTIATILWDLSKYSSKSALLDAIDEIKFTGGNTATADALNLMRTQVFGQPSDRPNNPNYAILITDGTATIREDSLQNEISGILAESIQMFTIGVRNSVNMSQIIEISSPPHKKGLNYFKSYSYHTLEMVRRDLLKTSYFSCISTMNPCTKDFYPDLAIVLDLSTSVCQDEHATIAQLIDTCDSFDRYVKFLIELVDHQMISKSGTHISLILFDTDAAVVSHLDKYYSKQDIIEEIRKVKFKGGLSFLTGALDLLRNQVFGSAANRLENPDVALIITDGLATIQVDKLKEQIDKLHQSNIRVLSVGIGENIDEKMIAEISSSPHQFGKDYFISNSISSQSQVLNDILIQMNITCQINEEDDIDIYGPFCLDYKYDYCLLTTQNTCYQEFFSDILCCRWCYDRKLPYPNCEYGDKSNSCPAIKKKVCSGKMSDTCCETCMTNSTVPKLSKAKEGNDNSCVDKVKNCTRLPPFDCYLENVYNDCCETCTSFKKPIPGCEFGNKARWCSPNVSCGIFTSEMCCETCYERTHNKAQILENSLDDLKSN